MRRRPFLCRMALRLQWQVLQSTFGTLEQRDALAMRARTHKPEGGCNIKTGLADLLTPGYGESELS